MATITIRILNGTPPYLVELISLPPTAPTGLTWNFGVAGIYILTGIPAGNYQVRVTDSNGCIVTSPGDIVVTTTTSTTSTTTTTEEPVTTTTELATTTTTETTTTTTPSP